VKPLASSVGLVAFLAAMAQILQWFGLSPEDVVRIGSNIGVVATLLVGIALIVIVFNIVSTSRPKPANSEYKPLPTPTRNPGCSVTLTFSLVLVAAVTVTALIANGSIPGISRPGEEDLMPTETDDMPSLATMPSITATRPADAECNTTAAASDYGYWTPVEVGPNQIAVADFYPASGGTVRQAILTPGLWEPHQGQNVGKVLTWTGCSLDLITNIATSSGGIVVEASEGFVKTV
jgi:hypothetical protein